MYYFIWAGPFLYIDKQFVNYVIYGFKCFDKHFLESVTNKPWHDVQCKTEFVVFQLGKLVITTLSF